MFFLPYVRKILVRQAYSGRGPWLTALLTNGYIGLLAASLSRRGAAFYYKTMI